MKQWNIFILLLMFTNAPSHAWQAPQREIERQLQQWATAHAPVVELVPLGESQQQRPISALRFKRRSPQSGTPTPKVLLLAGTHGDEIIGRELVMELARYLLTLPATHPHLAFLQHSELWLVPCHNPDGCDLGWRTDVKGRDLNRYFPRATHAQQIYPGHGDDRPMISQSPAEIAAIIKLFTRQRFQLGLTYHGGEIPTVNYPWDYSPEELPLTPLARQLAARYAELNPAMRANPQFADGVANGHHWYAIEGGMQDWALAYHDCLLLTPELTLLETPPAQERSRHIADNLSASLRFAGQIMQGGGFYFKTPELAGRAVIWQHAAKGKLLLKNVHFTAGHYYSVLMPGHYEIEIVSETPPFQNKKGHLTLQIPDDWQARGPQWMRLDEKEFFQ